MQVTTHSRLAGAKRRAVAVTELAVTLPAITVLVFASIESCSMIFVVQGLHVAAYEGARVAVHNSSDTPMVVERVQQILDGHGINGTTITCVPADVAAVAAGNTITVIVSAPCDANRVSPVFFFGSRNLEGRTIMAKE